MKSSTGIVFRHLAFVLVFIGCGWVAIQSQQQAGRPDERDDPTGWLYLRDGEIPPKNGAYFEFLAVGDIMLGRAVETPADPFELVSREISTADLALGNLEGVIAQPGKGIDGDGENRIPLEYRLIQPVQTPAQLVRAGFDLINIANNHFQDLGSKAAENSAASLNRAGIKTTGIANDGNGAYQAEYFNYHNLRIAVLGFNSVTPNGSPSPYSISTNKWQIADFRVESALNAVQKARRQADLVIVSMHWGEEYALHSNLWQQSIARQLAAAGADVIIGHHPHVIQETEVIPGTGMDSPPTFVAYSLGNFIFDQYDLYSRQGLALRVLFDQSGMLAVQGLPLTNVHRPKWVAGDQGEEILYRIRPLPRRLGFICGVSSCEKSLPYSDRGKGIFQNGYIDLTGDGQDERIWLHRGRIYIYQQDDLVWRSPLDWQVVDIALGDPNDDGRFEILAAIHRISSQGQPMSQPYVIGYRGGMYRQLWGGSPVSDPIQEVELGDVDGDGKEELIVIEKSPTGNQAVVVWNWHGWGFSLLWRSLSGRFRDLVVSKSSDTKDQISVGLSW